MSRAFISCSDGGVIRGEMLSADGPLLKSPDSASMAHRVVTEAVRRRHEKNGVIKDGGGSGKTAH
jgi:hypothetical protein